MTVEGLGAIAIGLLYMFSLVMHFRACLVFRAEFIGSDCIGPLPEAKVDYGQSEVVRECMTQEMPAQA